MNRRSFALILIASTVLIVAIVFFLTLQQPAKNEGQQGAPKATKNGLTITNAQQYTDKLDWSVITSVQDAAYRRIIAHGHAGAYQGVIRDNSFRISYVTYTAVDPPVNVPQYQFLLDIPAAKQSYSVSFSGGSTYPYSILYVLCPGAGQLIYDDFGCVDEN